MEAIVARRTERHQVFEIAGALWGVPHGVDVVSIQLLFAATDGAAVVETCVDARSLLSRPTRDVCPFGCDATLPKVRARPAPRSLHRRTPCLGRLSRFGERAPGAALAQAGERGFLF